MENIWICKIFAFLHDPPHKPCVLGKGHEEIGLTLAKAITATQISQEVLDAIRDAIKKADCLAAGADRSQLLGSKVFQQIQIRPDKDLTLIHPLDGTPLSEKREDENVFTEICLTAQNIDHARDLVEGKQSQDGYRDIVSSVIVQAFSTIADERLKYLALWRFLPEVLMLAEGSCHPNRFGALWELLPADTRMPTHPVLIHNSLVACLASIFCEGKHPALLKFSLSPVQPFIEASRTVADLWAGSVWLSLGLFEATKTIVDVYGPDSILYPSLRHQPLLDNYLLSLFQELEVPNLLKTVFENCRLRLEKALRIPSLPNIFVAIVPFEDATKIGEDCRHALFKAFEEKIDKVLQDPKFQAFGHNLEKVREQLFDLLDVNFVVVPWPSPDDQVEQYIQKAKDNWDVKNLDSILNVTKVLEGYKPNAGFLYPLLNEQASLLIDIAKRDRLKGKKCREEKGLKCSICGERDVLGESDFYKDRQLWRNLISSSDRTVKEGEHLCGICLTKRVFGREGIDGSPKVGRPSTSQIATARFKLDVVKRCKNDSNNDSSLYDKVKKFVEVCDSLGHDFQSFAPPAVYEACENDDILKKFARYDGFLLLPLAQGEIAEDKRRAVHEAAQELIQAARSHGIPNPSPYLAVVAFDGDEIGKWISGEKAPPLKAMFHFMAQDELLSQCPELKQVNRPLSPAIVGTITQICSAFARHAAPFTIEEEGLPGYLVYAGGDDVLFFAPPADALRLAWRLRLRFSGYPHAFDEADGDASKIRPWFRSNDGFVRLAFGKNATASAGMCIFHAKHPLGDALEEARAAQKRVKEAGRNALGITVLRRSGQVTQTMLPFFDCNGQCREREPFLMFLELVRFFMERTVSRSLGILLHSEFSAITGLVGTKQQVDTPFEMACMLAKRVIDRRLLANEVDIPTLRTTVLALGKSLKDLHPDKPLEVVLKDWADLVALAEFVARPYGRRE